MKQKIFKQVFFAFVLVIGAFSINAATNQNFLTSKDGKLYDAAGNSVRLTGVNWFGFETAQMQPHGLWSRDCKSMLMQMKDVGFNSVRIPWTNAMLRPGKTIKIDSYGEDSYTKISPMNAAESKFTSPIQLLEQILIYCQELNLKVILDSHARQPDNYMGETIWYDATCTEQQWIDDWTFLVNKFKAYDCFVACDLDNEPHGKKGALNSATWGNTTPATDWNKAAERCGNAILAVNPKMLIFVEGVESYESTSYWWGGNLQGVKKYPVVLNIPSQLVYSPHEYGPTVFEQLWFSDPKFPENLPALWDEYFGFLQTSGTSHLYVGEFGIKQLGGKDEIWIKKWLEYMGSSYSWAFWCWNPNSGDTGGVLDDQWKNLVQWKVDLIKPYFAPIIPNGTVVLSTKHTITATAGVNGTITPSGATQVTENSNQDYTILGNVGYKVSNVIVDGLSIGVVNRYTFSNVTSAHTIEASFTAAPTFNVTASAEANGVITPSGVTTVTEGASKTFTITPNSGYVVKDVKVNNVSVGAVTSYTIQNVTTATTIVATFTIGQQCSLLSLYGVPSSMALPSVNTEFAHITVQGSGGPSLSNVTKLQLNWDLVNNGLYSFAVNTNDGNPDWYVSLTPKATHVFSSVSPSVKITGSGINGLDGDYWVNMHNGNFVMVAKSGSYSIYFAKTNATVPTCIITSVENRFALSNEISITPNPVKSNSSFLVNIGEIGSGQISVIDLHGVEHITQSFAEQEQLKVECNLLKGLYLVKIVVDNKVITKKIIVQ